MSKLMQIVNWHVCFTNVFDDKNRTIKWRSLCDGIEQIVFVSIDKSIHCLHRPNIISSIYLQISALLPYLI